MMLGPSVFLGELPSQRGSTESAGGAYEGFVRRIMCGRISYDQHAKSRRPVRVRPEGGSAGLHLSDAAPMTLATVR